MGAPSKAYCFLMVQVHLGQKLATSPTTNLTFGETTNQMKLRDGGHRVATQVHPVRY